jgi:hypothetical protein
MKNLTIIILSLLLGGVIGWLIKPCKSNGPDVIVKKEVIYQDTGTHTVTIKPIPYKVIDPLTKYDSAKIAKGYIDLTSIVIDTAEDIKDHYTTRIYDTTLVNDSDMYIHLKWAVFMNKTLYIRPVWKNKRATNVINNITNPVKRNSIDLGTTLSLDNVYLDAMYHRDKNGFKISYSPIDKAILVGYSRKVLEW